MKTWQRYLLSIVITADAALLMTHHPYVATALALYAVIELGRILRSLLL